MVCILGWNYYCILCPVAAEGTVLFAALNVLQNQSDAQALSLKTDVLIMRHNLLAHRIKGETIEFYLFIINLYFF